MAGKIRMEKGESGEAVYCLTSHRRTITETDIVNFVNLIGLHEPAFIDMEWVKKEMPGIHNKRFAPAPFLISLGMGLVATSISELWMQSPKRRIWDHFMEWSGSKRR